MSTSVIHRKTKYCDSIEKKLIELGHATNAELLYHLKKSYPDLSATTVHRATARLAARGVICVAPSAHDGSMRYDSNTNQHDHFLCVTCGKLRDTDIKDKVVPILESAMDDCHISGRLTISGVCKNCKKREEQ